ncbi:hypothetical protein DL93DRAFT_2091278 [Clavulina sp. PMI_390]|nr:hypothetical protein DL93DRAFT_2091278 [Clavulina sp. PMI_390]
MLRALKTSGGEAGFKEWAAAPKGTIPGAKPAPKSTDASKTRPKLKDGTDTNYPYQTKVSLTAGSALLYEWVSVDAPGYTGSGSAWGLGAGFLDGNGLLYSTNPFATFATQTSTFQMEDDIAGLGAGGIEFYDSDDNTVGYVVLGAAGIGGFLGLSGPFTWS